MSKNKLPLISVVIPTYNSIKTIEKCLQSVKDQTYPTIEIIVVDGLKYNSENQKKCQTIIQKYARYIQDGPERSIQRNRGIHEAKGEFILTIDQDMYLTKHVVEECYDLLTQKNYSAILIPEISIGEGFWTQCVALDRYISVYLETGKNECCRFFRKKDALAIGGYDPSIVGAEDSDFHYRMAQRGPIGKIKAHINHDEGRTKFFDRVKKKYYYSKAFRKYLQRYPTIAPAQFSPFKSSYVKHIGLLIKHPLLTCGMVTLRLSEVAAGTVGLLFNT